MSVERNLGRDDEQARKDALDVRRSFIVQAPAGSGKTELLIQRYLCLLATVENPEEVLAITFTRKAAAEMRLRVVLALQRAARGDLPDAAHERITAAAATAVLARDDEAAWELIDNPRRMRIQTLDSLNASIARMRPLTAGATSGSATVDLSEMSALYRQAAAATLDWIGEQGDASNATERVLLHVDNNTGIYVDYLSRMLRTRDQWLPFVSAGLMTDDESNALRERFELSLERIVAAHLQSLLSSTPAAAISEISELAQYAVANLQTEGKADAVICRLDGLRNMPEANLGALDRWLALAEFLLKQDGRDRHAQSLRS